MILIDHFTLETICVILCTWVNIACLLKRLTNCLRSHPILNDFKLCILLKIFLTMQVQLIWTTNSWENQHVVMDENSLGSFFPQSTQFEGLDGQVCLFSVLSICSFLFVLFWFHFSLSFIHTFGHHPMKGFLQYCAYWAARLYLLYSCNIHASVKANS